MQAAQKAAFEIYEENASQDATFKEIYQQWKDFRDQVSDWNQINELSFSRFISQNSV
jgi:TRAP-type mannitol/chloroaromatic compound transport system substrate-binding protein